MEGETAEQVAERMRAIAASMSNKSDADEIVRYADWLVGPRPSHAKDEMLIFKPVKPTSLMPGR